MQVRVLTGVRSKIYKEQHGEIGGARIDVVAAGGLHSAAVTSAGELLTWGRGDRGGL